VLGVAEALLGRRALAALAGGVGVGDRGARRDRGEGEQGRDSKLTETHDDLP
jgi:hypothetical protein